MKNSRRIKNFAPAVFVFLLVAFASSFADAAQTATEIGRKDDGYRGIWYMNQPTRDEYKFKYSGGMATYPQQQEPIAVYSKKANKTFFCYGGTTARGANDKQQLLHMVSYFDHRTGEVPRPTILLNKNTSDAHDNPTLSIDDNGYIWIFSAAHGTARPSYIHRSKKPFSIDDFELIETSNFSYTQPWFFSKRGFLFLHTRYADGRNLFWMTSSNGVNWSEPSKLVKIDMGDYQISWPNGGKLATAFDFHPKPLGLNGRANLYYLETSDMGKTWKTVDGKIVQPPLTTTNNPALVYDSRAENLLVYLKDINFDAHGHPVILFLTSKGFEPGPANNPRIWKTAHWNGGKWIFHEVTTSLNNYDHGSLYVEKNRWRIIGPTERGPQPYNPGGEMAMWTSADEGATWKMEKQLTRNSPRNHNYARRPLNARPDFYALWADGNGRAPSESNLYFTDQKGTHVWRLPAKMQSDFAKPEIAW
jgi:hypothetical protein